MPAAPIANAYQEIGNRGTAILGDGTTNWWDVIRWANQHSYSRACYIAPGIYKAEGTNADVVQVASGVCLIGNPAVTLVSTLPVDANQLTCVFGCQVQTPLSSTLAANAAVGANTVSVVANIAPPDATRDVYIRLTPNHLGGGFGNRSITHRVISVSGTGPFTYTLDRPIRQAYSTGDAFELLVAPQNIYFDGGGMTMRGTGMRFVELVHAVRCTVKNIRAYTSGAMDIPFAFDVGGLENRFEDIYLDAGGAITSAGMALESNERSHIVRCVVRNAGTGPALMLTDCADSHVLDSTGTASNFGMYFTGDGVTIGCQSCSAVNCDFSKNASDGVLLDGTAVNSQITLSNIHANFNGGHGIHVSNGNTSTAIVNSESRGNTLYGLRTEGASKDTLMENTDLSDNIAGAASFTAEAKLVNCRGTISSASAIGVFFFDISTYIVRVINCDFTSTKTGINNVEAQSGVTLFLDGCDFGFSSTGIMADSGAVVHITNSRVFSNGPAISCLYVNGGTMRLGDDVDCDSAGGGTPLNVAAGFCNRGTVVANGVTPVDVTWPNIRSTDYVELILLTKGGTPSAMPAVTITAATKFTITSYAGDTSTYRYCIL